MIRRLDQERAKLAFEHVNDVKKQSEQDRNEQDPKKYASMVYATPALLRSAGLSQTLHFIESRKSDAQRKLLQHLAMQLGRVDESLAANGKLATLSARLLECARDADMSAYLRLTREALACMQWYVRFVQGVLRIEPGATDVDGN